MGAGGRAEQHRKPSALVQAARALSQLALAFYVLLLAVVLLATSGKAPGFPVMMAVLALVPVILGPGMYRAVGVVALVVSGAVYLSSKPPVRQAAPPAQASLGAPAVAQSATSLRAAAH